METILILVGAILMLIGFAMVLIAAFALLLGYLQTKLAEAEQEENK